MKIVVPSYYRQFCCIADRCRHTCCRGWEIDIDRDTLERYRRLPGGIGEKLRSSIVWDDCPHFQLDGEERCPFLTENNLCQLIEELGEGSLCQICADHPRFRNVFAGRTEVGLGLTCEAAAALILGETERVGLVTLSDDGTKENTTEWEEEILAAREQVFTIVQDRSQPVDRRVARLIEEMGIRMPDMSNRQWAEVFTELERMDPAWDRELRRLESCPDGEEGELPLLELPFEQLLHYFFLRHLPEAEGEADLLANVGYGLLGYRVLRCLCLYRERRGGCTLCDLLELARLYSSEIEYSDENTEALLDLLWEEYFL